MTTLSGSPASAAAGDPDQEGEPVIGSSSHRASFTRFSRIDRRRDGRVFAALRKALLAFSSPARRFCTTIGGDFRE
jgi:hypothetical protein